jgi:predicted transcriptional regulator
VDQQGHPGMLKNITDFFIKYAKAVPPSRMAFQMMMTMIMVSWVGVVVLLVGNFPLVTDMWHRYRSDQNVRVEDALVVTNQINVLLREQQVRLDVDRIYVSKFHNGKVDLSGVHFIYFSRVAEATGPGVSNEINQTQSLPLSIFPDMLKALSKNECYYIEQVTDSVESNEFLETMGVNSMMVCPITSVDNRLIGIIGVDGVLSSINTLDEVEVRTTLNTLAGVIGSLFTSRT